MHFNFFGHVKGRYNRSEEPLATTVEEAKAVVDHLLTTSPSEEDTQVVVSRSDTVDGIEVIVDPGTGYVTLSWSGYLQSKNPTPFADAPLIAHNYDDDPLIHMARSSYVSVEVAREALYQYVETGGQPTAVEWEPQVFEVYELPGWVADEPEEARHFVLIEPSGVDGGGPARQ
ncbi:Imm1 family immunity protein [Saccharothrix sp. HUAS TT1]|uniref:Imm1 family immunity protein n=1 Tax=unclassified Saccharothrix TaxID=2593673 RepID=UPI00345BF3BA